MSEMSEWNKERWDEEAKRHGFATARSMLITLHLFRSYSLVSIAQLLGCSRWIVTRLMGSLGVPIHHTSGTPYQRRNRSSGKRRLPSRLSKTACAPGHKWPGPGR
jgi:AraC-like DNA-binding protein